MQYVTSDLLEAPAVKMMDTSPASCFIIVIVKLFTYLLTSMYVCVSVRQTQWLKEVTVLQLINFLIMENINFKRVTRKLYQERGYYVELLKTKIRA